MDRIPVIDMNETGANITRLRKERNMSVKELQVTLGFNTPQAIFKWQRGESLPSIDNLVILAKVFDVSMDDIVKVR